MATALPTLETKSDEIVDEVEMVESESVTVANPECELVEWVTVSVPVYVGPLGGKNLRDRMESRLVGRKLKEVNKRLSLGLDFACVTLSNGKECSGQGQDNGIFILEAISEQLDAQKSGFAENG